MKNDWNPALYRQFEIERTRPARELLSQINFSDAQRITDLGCGPGNSTELLVENWPAAHITAVDNSPAMLEAASARLPQCHFQLADIARWQAEQPQDLIYANASLQWLGHHEQLIPHLLDQLAERGVLAVQMPDNLDEPSHRSMREVAALPQWQSKIRDAITERKRLPHVEAYYDLLAAAGFSTNIWRTTYYHVMPSAAAIIDWLKATGLRPFLAPLSASEQQQFLSRYLDNIVELYPPRADGTVLLAFPRLFLVASRSDK